MEVYSHVRVMAREQTPEKALLRALLAVGFLRIAMHHSSNFADGGTTAFPHS
jgi:hypothetical protein